jgi:ATP-dependent Zn protease
MESRTQGICQHHTSIVLKFTLPWRFCTYSTGVCNTACFLASRLGRTEVTQADLVAAVEQTKYGRVYEAGRFISPGRKQRFAVVESGYCLAAALLPAIEPIDYVTILPSIKSPVGRTVLKVGT